MLLRVNKFWSRRGKQKPVLLKTNTIPYFLSTRTWAMFHNPNQNPQAPGPFTLVQVLLLICLLLGLAVLTAPARTKHSKWVQGKDLPLQQAQLSWPAEARAAGTCHSHDTTHNQGSRILTLPCVFLASTEHQRKHKSVCISAFKEKEKKVCAPTTFSSNLLLQLRAQIAFYPYHTGIEMLQRRCFGRLTFKHH